MNMGTLFMKDLIKIKSSLDFVIVMINTPKRRATKYKYILYIKIYTCIRKIDLEISYAGYVLHIIIKGITVVSVL